MATDVQQQVRTAQAANQLQTLYIQQRIWDTYLAEVENIPKTEVAGLQKLAVDLQKSLLDATISVDWLMQAADANGWREEQFVAAIESTPVDAQIKQRVLAKAKVAGGLRDYLFQGCTSLAGYVGEQQAKIAASLQQVKETGHPGPQLRDRGYVCAAATGMALGGALSMQPEFVILGLFGMALEC